MKIYSVSFRKYNDYSKKVVDRVVNGKIEKLNVPEGGALLVPEIDLMKYMSYGDGYDKVIFVGDLDDRYFMSGNTEIARKTIGISVDKILGS